MKKNKLLITGILLTLVMTTLVGCTEQSNAKNLGGTYTMELPKGKKLLEVTWKDDELWYLTRDMKEDEQAETYEFKEDSSFGIMEGTVIIKETK